MIRINLLATERRGAKAAVAPGLVEMLQIPGMGPKKVRALHDKLGIADIADELGIGRTAVWTWMQEPEVAAEIDARLAAAKDREVLAVRRVGNRANLTEVCGNQLGCHTGCIFSG
mgnify:CR=1 FL=1